MTGNPRWLAVGSAVPAGQRWLAQFIVNAVLGVRDGQPGVDKLAQIRAEFTGIMNGITTEGIDESAYGLVQAAIEFQQHVRGVRGATDLARQESRFKRAYLDRDTLTTTAITLAREVATADV